MTFSNKFLFRFFQVALSLLIAAIVFDFALSSINGSIGSFFNSHWLAYSSLSLIFIFTFIRISFFSYEDEYEIIHIKSKPLLLGLFLGKSDINSEFPKRTVKKVDLKTTSLGKRLMIVLQTQHGEKRMKSFNVAFIASHKLDKVHKRLSLICEQNKDSF